jgi:hypothetical protein
MIKHIVMFKLNDSLDDKPATVETLKNKLESLKNKINQVVTLEVGKNISDRKAAHDLVLVTEFASVEDLDIYRDHPEHLAIVEYIKKVVGNIVVVDYEIN